MTIEIIGDNRCRGCKSSDLFVGLDLGTLPIANELAQEPTDDIDEYPLKLMICNECGLGQVADVTTSERIFSDYRYLSSTSSIFLTHAKHFAEEQTPNIKNGEWVLEIASNDGYLLQYFMEFGVKVLGVEPAVNVSKIAADKGINTINEFFSAELARVILEKYGHPKLIIANNVLAHVPDINDFLLGLSILSTIDTKISIENPSLSNILIEKQFDTIYHEHYSYLSVTSVANLSKGVGLTLLSVEKVSTHGGSIRYWLSKTSSNSKSDASVHTLIAIENDQNLFDPKSWINFASEVKQQLHNFRDWATEISGGPKTICGYGAAAKASTLINASKLEPGTIKAIADNSLEKQGRYMPTNNIPIIKPQDLIKFDPTDIIIFPWNISEEIEFSILQIFQNPPRIWKGLPY
jgi:hypothetical protein